MLNNKSLRGSLAVFALSVSLVASGCGSGSTKNVVIQGVTGPNVSFVNNLMTMTVVLQNVALDAGGRISIPQAPNSYLEIGPDFQSNGTLISLGLDANDINNLTGHNANLLNPLQLPGGRPLPGVAAGSLPGLAIQVPKWDNMVLYFGPSVFGTFVPVKLPFSNFIGSYRFYADNGTAVGTLSVVGADAANANSGFLLLINISGTVANLLKTAPQN